MALPGTAKKLELPASDQGKSIFPDIDGAMSYAMVWLTGHLVGGWPYGYNSFRMDLTPYVVAGEENQLAIRLDNPPQSSRGYPGGGIYRNVWLVKTHPVHVAQWGTYITAREISASSATLEMEVTVDNDLAADQEVELVTKVYPLYNDVVRGGGTPKAHAVTASAAHGSAAAPGKGAYASFAHTRDASAGMAEVASPVQGYDASIEQGKNVSTEPGSNEAAVFPTLKLVDPAGGSASVSASAGISDPLLWGPPPTQHPHLYMAVTTVLVNGKAVDRTTTRFGIRDLEFDPDRGLLVNGEQIRFQGVNQHHDLGALGAAFNTRAAERQLEILREMGCNAIRTAHNPPAPEFLELTDRMGFLVIDGIFDVWARKKTPLDFHLVFPDWYEQDTRTFVRRDRNCPSVIAWSVGNEVGEQYTGEEGAAIGATLRAIVATHFVSAYELYTAQFGASPDKVFASQDRHPYVAGEFVWSGWDYLGEPTPYYLCRSSYCGIIDLPGFKKDRFWLYQSRWRPDLPMAHILPHWNWPERMGRVTPAHVFTSGDEAELFLNGVSQGRKKKGPYECRLRWDDVVYVPGKLSVKTYKNGLAWAERTVLTTGQPDTLFASADRNRISADGKDLSFITVKILDANGNLVPDAANLVKFSIGGPGELIATDNGSPCDMTSFVSPERKAFSGLVLGIVRSLDREKGTLGVTVSAEGLKPAVVEVRSY
ncbi:MAG: glycoside hydrolase family 2 TIM barrel-domain containing protein [Bacteroidales bacterium]|nr:glycoside hydrolase family 2 TIM barrel-domain containing protein [Bacteroidales bacterium]